MGNKNCKIESYTVQDTEEYSGEKNSMEGLIRNSQDGIELVFEDYSFSGKKHGEGHWVLRDKFNVFEGSMTLHQLPNSKIYEGFYQGSEDGESYKGFIRVFEK